MSAKPKTTHLIEVLCPTFEFENIQGDNSEKFQVSRACLLAKTKKNEIMMWG